MPRRLRKPTSETFDANLNGRVYDGTKRERPATPAEMARGRARKAKKPAKKAPAKKAPPKKKLVPGDVAEEDLPKIDENVSTSALRERRKAIEDAMREMEAHRDGDYPELKPAVRQPASSPPKAKRRTKAQKDAIRARAEALVDRRRAEERVRLEAQQLAVQQLVEVQAAQSGKTPDVMHDKPVEGLRAGTTTLDVKDSAVIKRMEVSADKNVHGKAEGRAILRAMMREDRLSIDNILAKTTLWDLTPGESSRLIDWILKNSSESDLRGRRKGRDITPKPTPEGKDTWADRESNDLPNEQLTQQQRDKRRASPGFVSMAMLKDAARGTKVRPVTSVRMLKKGEKPKKVSTRDAPADPRIVDDPLATALTPQHGDPTAAAAMRHATKKAGRGGKGSKARREAARDLKFAKERAAQKKRGGGEVSKALNPQRKLMHSMLRAARAAQYKESLHRRDMKGRYADKPGAGNDAPKKPKKKKPAPTAHGELKDQLKSSRQSLERLTGHAAEAPAKKPAKKKAAPKKVQPRAFADFEQMLKDRGDTDLFSQVAEAVETGKVKSLRRNEPRTLSKTYLFEDGNGGQFLVKQSSYDPNAEADDTISMTQGDVVDDYLVSKMLNDMGIPSQRPIGFASDPNDLEKASVVMESAERHMGREMEHATEDHGEFLKHEWADRTEFMKLMVMDYLTNNHDRHAANWFEYEDDDGRHIYAIDHSLVGGSAARARGQERKEVVRAERDGADDHPEDVIEAESTRTPYGFIASGSLVNPDPTNNNNLSMAERVGALYADDEEAFYDDLMDFIDEIVQKQPILGVESDLDEIGVTGEARQEGEDLMQIMQGRLLELAMGLDSGDDLWAVTQDAESGWKSSRKAATLARQYREYLESQSVDLDVDLSEGM